MKSVLIAITMLLISAMGAYEYSYAQNGKSAVKEYKLTEIQQLRLSNTQKDAQLLQAQLQNIQRQFQDKVTQLMSEAQKVKLENSWPPETAFNPDTLVFSAPVKEEKKP